MRCDLTQVKATNRGGRLHSAVYEAKALPNGTLGYLGGYVNGSTEVRAFLAPTTALIAKELPVIIMKPEIMYDERLKTIGDFINPANKPFPVVPLEDLDGFDLSSDYFDMNGKTAGNRTLPEVGDMFTLQANDTAGTQLKYAVVQGPATEPAVAQNAFYFKVIGVKDSHVATYLMHDGVNATNRFPAPYKMVALEVVKPIA